MLRAITRRLPRRAAWPQSIFVLRSFSLTCVNMAGSVHKVDTPFPATLPADAYQLLSTTEKAGAAEDALFDQQVHDVKQWWATSRYDGIKRPYSAEDIVSKRGSLQQTYPSSLMARKLFNLFRERASNGEPVHTSLSHQSFELELYMLMVCSGCHRSCTNDPASCKSRGIVYFRMGLLLGPY